MFRWKQSVITAVAAVLLMPGGVNAGLMTSTHFRLDANVADNVGGAPSSTSYALVDAGGEAVVGAGASGSYQLTQGYVAQLTHSLQLSLLPSGLAAYYPFDTGTGIQAYDVSTNQNRAVLTGSPTWLGTGELGGAISFNGSTQYGDAGDAASLQVGTGTLDVWVKCTLPGSGTVGVAVKPNAFGWFLVNGVAEAENFNTSTMLNTGVNVADGNWHELTMTFQTGVTNGTILYVDGISKLTTTMAVVNQSSDLVIGAGTLTPTQTYNGSVDELKLYNRVLSAAEVTNNRAATLAGLSAAVTIPTVTPGVSQNASINTIVRTDAGGYTLAISQNHALLHTDASTTIPPVSGSIASPGAWTEGTTKGLGFTLTAGTSLESAWGTSPNFNYAALPGSATTYHTVTGFSGGTPDQTTMQFREDVANTQKSGSYSNTVTITATLKP